MTWQGEEIESTALMKSLESITSNGQCSYSQMNETNEESIVETINSKLKNLTRFTYGSEMDQMMLDFDVCKGMIQGYIDSQSIKQRTIKNRVKFLFFDFFFNNLCSTRVLGIDL